MVIAGMVANSIGLSTTGQMPRLMLAAKRQGEGGGGTGKMLWEEQEDSCSSLSGKQQSIRT